MRLAAVTRRRHPRHRAGGVPHGFLGRAAGVDGDLAGLNCGWGSGDDRALDRREPPPRGRGGAARRAAGHRPPDPFADAWSSAGAWPDDDRPHADALVTDRPGLLLGILTADCAPVLLADREAGVVGAAHAGWRGALAGVTDAGDRRDGGARRQRDRIAAAVGPCIARASYEVDRRLRRALPRRRRRPTSASSPTARAASRISTSKPMSSRGLAAAGVAADRGARPRHLCRPDDRFFSYRRATHRGEPDYGRQISLIGLAAPSDALRADRAG